LITFRGTPTVTLIGALVFAAFAVSTASEDYPAVIGGWGDGLELDERIAEQIAIYSGEEDDLGPAYPESMASTMRRLVFEDATRALADLRATPGEPVVEVSFLESGFASPDGKERDDKHQRQFEEGFIRTEATAFFAVDGMTAEEAMREYTSADLRMSVSSRIKRIWKDDDLSCVEVKGVRAIMSPTLACNRVDELIEPGLASQHSQVVANPGDDDFQTVYFKESLKTFVAVEGGIAYHYINYTRAVKLGSIKRSFGRGKIEESEAKKIRELQSRLSDGSQ